MTSRLRPSWVVCGDDSHPNIAPEGDLRSACEICRLRMELRKHEETLQTVLEHLIEGKVIQAADEIRKKLESK